MDAFVSRKKPRLGSSTASSKHGDRQETPEEDSTDVKLAILLSLHPDIPQERLLDVLVSCDGSIEAASSTLLSLPSPSKKLKRPAGVQMSLSSHYMPIKKEEKGEGEEDEEKKMLPTRKGKTLHLYSPEDIATHTPCTIIHNFLPASEANNLLEELLGESPTFTRYQFQLFNRTVQSSHTSSLYVSTPEDEQRQTAEYTYGGTYRTDVRQVLPTMRAVSASVQQAVNREIQTRIRTRYPGGKKLQFQAAREWTPNAAFVNCYAGPAEHVGFHSDDLTYLGPRPVIGSLSLGVEREFRIRRIIPKENTHAITSTSTSSSEGQIAIHLPHNSLLVMHAEMQEEWKHAIAPAQTVSPHPLAGNIRINITYRWYRDSLHPRFTPRCRCGVHTILRCVQRKMETRGRYMWMCHAGYLPGKQGCSFFQWAHFDDDGDPIWSRKANGTGGPTLSDFVDSGTKPAT
ncbi:hypothetical protein ASPZODRAFT_58609 [Penicilliopsis zonata CBS 506.65]|uniref:Fe2OG dioxygenase domain-containing protein n=1 Tax=Penicilliopsis zonata CBS 506.65 TaxID=1073090 RepID=A0A1L9SSE8_9EURO|nr:hypothetical protein ASPZODRAFT_58609 [Penicilliopsis zonata CBS 506.65]OJJ50053.1 hypothetical protein ASPZODRAFT_58609 [Penicilliopsis zonata CBS 506.65]